MKGFCFGWNIGKYGWTVVKHNLKEDEIGAEGIGFTGGLEAGVAVRTLKMGRLQIFSRLHLAMECGIIRTCFA